MVHPHWPVPWQARIVWLAPLEAQPSPYTFGEHSRPARLAQKHKAFEPHLLVVRAGSVVDRLTTANASWCSRPVKSHGAAGGELPGGEILDVIRDAADPTRLLLAVCAASGTVTLTETVAEPDKILVPFSLADPVAAELVLAAGVEAYSSRGQLLTDICTLLQQVVELRDDLYGIVGLFVMATWICDRLPLAPYLAIVGLPQSGKTTLLQTLALVCRRSFLCADFNLQLLTKACSQYGATVLLDEALSAPPRDLYRWLRTANTRGVNMISDGKVLTPFGPKVISWSEPPNDSALNSRCVVVPMLETQQRSLLRPDDPRVTSAASRLRCQLQQFRFDLYRQVRMPDEIDGRRLRPRNFDLAHLLAAPFYDDADMCERVHGWFRLYEIHS
jgi:hypothetical protein